MSLKAYSAPTLYRVERKEERKLYQSLHRKKKSAPKFLRMWSGNKSHDIAGIRMSRMEASVWHDFGSVLSSTKVTLKRQVCKPGLSLWSRHWPLLHLANESSAFLLQNNSFFAISTGRRGLEGSTVPFCVIVTCFQWITVWCQAEQSLKLLSLPHV